MAHFSLTFSKPTGVGRFDKSTRHLWKLFRWRFPNRHRLSLCWLFLSEQGLRALSNHGVTFGMFLGDDFGVGSEPVFVDYLWVNMGCGSWQIHASPLESILLMISEMSMSQFSLTVSKSTGDELADESMPKVFCWRLPIQHRLKFYWLFWVNRQCEIF